MTQLRQGYERIKQYNAEVIVIGPDPLNTFQDYWKKNDLPFVGLPDNDRKVLKAYKQQVNWIKLERMPALFIIDNQGLIRHVHYGNAMSDILPMEKLYEVLSLIQ